MNKKLKAKWLRALRGGSYRQEGGALVNNEGTSESRQRQTDGERP